MPLTDFLLSTLKAEATTIAHCQRGQPGARNPSAGFAYDG
jgi:hypothetical protein